MQAVLENNNVTLKMQLLKARANRVLNDDSLRHTPNDHDIKECSDNTKLLHTHQEKTIRKGDDRMSALAQYLEANKELAYKIASENTPYNASGRPVIKKDDEWRDESEWDDLYMELSKTH